MLTTKTKMRIARILNRVLLFGRSAAGRNHIVLARRGGINWRLDLNEGIDLAIYLGLYQKVPARILAEWIPPGSLVFDIGSNLGAFTLPLARQIGRSGRVVAIEPTSYVFEKLVTNTALNPDLVDRVIRIHAALCDEAVDPTTAVFYSRWPLRGNSSDRHERHLGQFESAQEARFLRLDELVGELRSDRQISGPVKFIKLDVDGHELQVLRGGSRLFQTDSPPILIEIAPSVQDEVPGRFDLLLQTLQAYGYGLEDSHSGKPFPMSAAAFRNIIKDGASIDAIARCR